MFYRITEFGTVGLLVQPWVRAWVQVLRHVAAGSCEAWRSARSRLLSATRVVSYSHAGSEEWEAGIPGNKIVYSFFWVNYLTKFHQSQPLVRLLLLLLYYSPPTRPFMSNAGHSGRLGGTRAVAGRRLFLTKDILTYHTSQPGGYRASINLYFSLNCYSPAYFVTLVRCMAKAIHGRVTCIVVQVRETLAE